MSLVIKDAVKKHLRARIGLLALTGGGKTYTGLKFLFAMKALGMARKVGVIDTEHGSASKYLNDPFPDFRVIEMEDDFSPENYIEAMTIMAADGVDALMVDSLSHAWAGKGGSLELKDRFGKQKGFNDYTAWGPVTAMQNRLIESLLAYPGHLIATMRVKMEHVIEKDPVSGRNVVRKVGLQPVQRDGLEYEMDLVGDLDQDHNFTVSKTRCRSLDGYSANKPGEEVIRKLKVWLESGTAEVVARPTPREDHPATSSPTTATASAPVADTPTASVPSPTPISKTSSTVAIDPLLAEIEAAKSKADLDAIVPKVGALPEVRRAVLRAAWMEKSKRVAA